ncbi:hypothetical protein [Oceanisphaera sp. W20_SRM_FM3]|uniref:hypothetical protein n=1 Tax=Oceanisphaera sp. W20_SRM_FM3 TaxID=3240267 RepID=UPI003F996EA0
MDSHKQDSKKPDSYKQTALWLGLLSCGLSLASLADEGEHWQFEVTPYLFAAGLDGTVGVRGVTSELDVPFSDLVDDLDMGFMGLVTARKGPWSYGLETIYVKLSDQGSKSVTGPFGRVTLNGALDVSSEMYITQGSVAYRVLDNSTALDMIWALRYTQLDTQASVAINSTPSIVFPGGEKTASGSDSWTDAVIGVRVLHPLNEQWSLLAYGDVGGGGSKLTYQLLLGADWQFAENFTAKAGYRQLYWDYEKGGTVWDMTMAGPYLGLGIQF